jgi:hypothetical protein
MLEKVLLKQISLVDPDEMIGWASTFLAETQRPRYEAQIMGRTKTYADAAHAQHLTDLSLSARVLIELAARVESTGRRRVDPVLNLRLQSLAHQVWQAHLAAGEVRFRIRSPRSIRLTKDGRIEIEQIDVPPFRSSAMHRAYVKRMADRKNVQSTDLDLARQLAQALQEGQDVPSQLQGIDEALQACRGYGLVAFLAALSLASQISGGTTDNDVVGVGFTEGQLRETIERAADEVYPQLAVNEVWRALLSLVWRQDLLREMSIAISDFQEVPARLLSRPLIERRNGTIYIPKMAAAFALNTFTFRLLEGTWFEDLSEEDELLRRALEVRRGTVRPRHEFERELVAELAQTRHPFRSNVKQARADTVSELGVALRSEVDAVVLVEPRHEIWVIEAKDLAYPFSPRRVRSELDKYTRSGGHFDKLAKKVHDVAHDPAAVAAALGVRSSSPYSTKGLFVTRELSPAAFLDDAPFPSIVLDSLSNFLGR